MRAYGGRGNDESRGVAVLPDGGCIVVGATGSNDVMVMKNRGGLDAWAIRLDKYGNLLWEKTYGGLYNDRLQTVLKAPQNTFLLIGSTDSYDEDIEHNHGRTDILVIKVDSLGRKIWLRTYGGSSFEEPYSAAVAKESNQYWIVGTTFSTDGDVQQNKGRGDLWLLRIEGSEGAITFSKTYGGSKDEGGNGLFITPENHLLIAATTRSYDGDVKNPNKGVYDAWLIKLDSTGKILWEKTFGGHENESFQSVAMLPTGDYLAIGFSASKDQDLWMCEPHGGNDGWIVAVRDPINPPQIKVLPPTALVGYVYDKQTKKLLLDAEITLVDNRTNKVIARTKPHPELGYYTLILPDTGWLSVGVQAKGYLFISQQVAIPKALRYSEIRQDFYLEPIRKGQVFRMYNVHFDPGKWEIKPESYAELDRLATFLKEHPNIIIEISGHTDNTGEPDTKMELSLLRAKAVMAYLMKKGIPKYRMKVKGYGMTRPIASNDTEEGRRLNRRVEFKILKIQ